MNVLAIGCHPDDIEFGMAGTLIKLKEAGYGVYYLSNFFQKAEEDCEERMGFLELTDGGILSYKDKVTKPDKQIYELLLDRYGLKAEECVFLDDTKKNIDGAGTVGIKGILFKNRAQAVEELQKLGVKTLTETEFLALIGQ